MVGEGEGIVAIVQALRDAGLAVTVMGGRGRCGSIIALNQPSQHSPAKSTVETGTSALPPAHSDAAVRTCDDRYISSYQLAHCRARPSSPPVQLAAFPPRRPEPCPRQGNFEIGTGESKSPAMSVSPSHTLRNSYTSVDRSLLQYSRSSRYTDAFVDSLRRYPSSSPGRSISSELVQRLLTYTQAKNFSKGSYHTKSMRTLRSKHESPKEITHKTKSSKSVQTYTRTKLKDKMPKVEEGRVNLKEEKKRPRSPVKSLRDVRCRDNQINATYDYLKSSSPRRYSAISADVRYLSDMTRCLRDTLRQICEDQPVVCPNIQNRYSEHRRQHHRASQENSPGSNNTPRASMVSTGVPAMSSCEAMEGTYRATGFTRPKGCCYCQKPMPCSCTQKSAVQFQRFPQVLRKPSIDANTLARSRSLSKDESCCVCRGMPVNEFEKKVREQVFNWLDEVPVYANDKPEDRRTRQDMARKLVEKLKGLRDDENFEGKVKMAIAECVKNMPMWCPGNRENQEMFQQQIADSLLDQIRNLSKKDKFENEISTFVEGLSLKTRDSQGQVIDKQSVVDNISKRLTPLALNQPVNSEDYKESLKSEMVDILEDLPIKVHGDKKTYLKNLADKLATQLHTIPAKDISKRSSAESLEDEFQKQIWKWLENVPEFSRASESQVPENQKSVKALATKLQKLQAQGIEDTSVQEQMQNEINEWLETYVGKTAPLDLRAKTNLAENLVQKLVTASKCAAKKKANTPLNEDTMTQQILDSLNDIPEVSSGNEKENQKMVKELAKKLCELHSQGKDETELEDEILNWLITAAANKGKRLDARRQENFTNKLLSKIKMLSVAREDDQTEENACGSIPIYKAKKGYLSPKIQDPTIQLSKSRGSEAQSPLQKEIFKDSAEREIIDFIQELTGDSSALSTKKFKAAAENLAQRVGDIMSKKNSTLRKKRENIEMEISKSLQSLSVDADGSQASELADRLQNLAFKNSTPRRTATDAGYSFRPHPDSSPPPSSTISTIDESHLKMPAPTKEEDQYMNKLAKIIDDWMSNLPVDLSTEDGKGFKEVMIRDLAGDIIDRQKYLQLNPDAKTSDDEELEQLKYLVFRWLNKVPNVKDIMPSIAKTDYLMERIKGVPVPQLINTHQSMRGRRSSKQRDSNIQHLSQELSALENEIQRWIQAVPSKFYATSNRDVHHKMVRDLAQQINQLQREEELTKKLLEDVITNFLHKMLKEYNERYFTNLTERLKAELLNKNLISQLESPILASKSRKVMNNIDRVQSMSLPKPNISVYADQLKNTLREEVGLILDESNVHCDNRDQIESILTDILAYQLSRGDTDPQTKDKLMDVLRDSDMSKNKIEEIASQLIDRAKKGYLSHKTQDSTIQLSKPRGYEALSPMQREMFKDSAEREIIDFIQELTGDSSALSTKKFKAAVENLAQRVGEIMSENDSTVGKKRESIEMEISKCLQSLSVDADGSEASELADRLQNLAFKTSTPRRPVTDAGYSFRPHSDSSPPPSSTISAIDESHLKMPPPTKEEDQYMNKLVEIIDDWMNNLPVDLNTEDGKGFKEVMIRDLAGGIIDRQKYLQLNPDTKTSDDEELEHFKYLVFRWLNKVPNVKDIMLSIAKTDYLMERIKGVPLPQLVNTHVSMRGRRSSKQRDSNIQHLSQELSALENEIQKWIQAVPSKFNATSNRDVRHKMVKDLAQQINQLQREEELTENLLEDVITNFLKMMLKEYNERYFTSLTEGLKAKLLNKGLISQLKSPILASNSIVMQKINKVQSMSLPKPSISVYADQLKNTLREEVGLILDESNVHCDNRDQIESILTDILAYQLSRGDTDPQTKDRLMDVLRDSDMSKNQIEEIASQLIDRAKKGYLSHKTQDSTIQLSKSRGYEALSPVQREMFKDSVEREIIDFIQELTGDSTALSTEKFKAAAENLAQRVCNIMSANDSTVGKKRESIEMEISKYLQSLSVDADGSQARELADRLQNLAFKASTPRRSVTDAEYSFRPHPDSSPPPSSTMSAIDESHLKMPAPTKEEDQYMNKLVKIIDDWMNDLPVDLNTEDWKSFKEVMIRDLAGDIIDRQKYLQLNPDAKTSDDEELEHLKYQVFRWLNKVPNVKDMHTQMHVETGIEEILPLLEEWINSLSLQISKPSVENIKIDSLKKDFAKTLYQLKQQYPTPNEKVSDILKEEIRKYMQQLPINPAKIRDPQFVSDKIKELHQKLLRVQSQLRASNRPSISVDDVKDIILNWAKNLPFQPGKTIEKFESEVNKTAPKLKTILTKVPAEAIHETKPELQKEIKTFVKKLPLQKNKVKDDHISELANHLHDFVKTTAAALPSMTTDSSLSSQAGFKKAADVLYDNVADWCDKLPIDGGNTPEEKEKVKTLKQNIATKLINIIGDLNVNPQVFNDDALYEHLLNDEIDNLISTIPQSPELEKNLPELEENLIEKIKEAKAKTQDELAGQAYKQQLRDAISKTLPSLDDLSVEEQAPFEVLKDNLADAYINLHFAAGDEEIKHDLKNKIRDEINKFCNDYLQRYPASPIDAKKLNGQLYNVLQKVPVPKDETIKSQVEQLRIKAEINDWLKELPLKDDESPTEQLQKNKIVTLLAKRLHDIEKEKDFNPDLNVGERMQKEIKKWIKKLPIQPGEENKAEEMVEQLVSMLEDSEDSRRFSVSNIRHSVDTVEQRKPREASCPFYSKFDRPVEIPAPPTRNRYLSQYAPSFPTSTLSTEDRARLEKIRERNQQEQLPFKPSPPQPCQFKDASVNPISIGAGSQTDFGPSSAKAVQSQMGPSSRGQASPSSADFASCCQPPGSPQVVVKEYYWDSPDSTLREPGNIAPCGQAQSASFQGHTLPSRPQQPPQFSWPQTQVNLPPSCDQPSSYSRPQGMFSTPDQTRMPQASCMMPPPVMGQQIRPPQSSCMSTTPQRPSQSQCLSPTPQAPFRSPSAQGPCTSEPRIRSPQSPCMSPPTSIPPQSCRTQPYPSAPPMPPCMSKPSPQMRPSCMNQPQIPEPQFPFMSQTPCMKTPQMSHAQIPPCMSQETAQHRSRHGPQIPCMKTPQMSYPQMPPCMSQETAQHRSSHMPPCQSQERRESGKFRQPCFGSPEMSSTSSHFDTDPDIDNRFSPKVTHLGSLDDVPCSKTCGSQSPRAKRSRGSPGEDYCWNTRFPEDERFWGTSCPRRRAHRSPNRSSEGMFVKEKERKEDKRICRCRERILTKCIGRRPRTCNQSCQLDDDSMSHCSKFCGAYCPHPSYLFFR